MNEGRGEKVYWGITVYEDATAQDVIRVVSYGGKSPVIEKRHFYLDGNTGEWRHGKVRGFSAVDFARIINSIDSYWEDLSKGWKSSPQPEAIPAQVKEQKVCEKSEGDDEQ